MPKMGGRELLQIMSDDYPEIPKIVLTGFGTNDDIILSLKTGAYDFLTKPITDFTILEHSVTRALEKKHLNDDRNRYIEQLKQINEIISMLNRGKSTEDIFNTLNVSLKKVIPFNRLALCTIHPQDDIVSTKLVASDRNVFLDANVTYKLYESSLKNVFKSQDVLNIIDLNDYLNKNSKSDRTRLLIKEGMKSSLVLPLIVQDITRGFLIFASVSRHAFNSEHIAFLKAIVGQISLSIQRGELLYEIRTQTKNLELLVDLRTQEILKTQRSTVFALSALAESHDPETGDHLERMRNYSVLLAQIQKYIGKQSEITNQFLRDLYDSSVLHDIGKLGVADHILLKPGPLLADEWDLMKNHTTIGYNALKSASKDLGEHSFLKMAMDVTLYHHEKWNGKGYPKGLKRDEIPLSARIVAIADVYDALTSVRPYKESFSHEKAIEIMKSESTNFDPDLYKIFYNNAGEFNRIREEIKEKFKV
jgi:response regulator RpfG family c-di-GMP phosphodiesterase